MVEVHDEDDLERALQLDPDVIGINNRNLADLSVDTRTTPELITDVPAGITVVAESGYSDPAQVEELERIGVDAVLIGESLMRAGDPEGGGPRRCVIGRAEDPRAPALRRALRRPAAGFSRDDGKVLATLQRSFWSG